MSSLLKYFTKSRMNNKQKEEQPDSQQEAPYYDDDEPNLQNARSSVERMSVSRSGRFKQRERRRSSLFQNPGLSIANDNAKTVPEETNGQQKHVDHVEYNDNDHGKGQDDDLENRNIEISTKQKSDQKKLQAMS